METGLLITFAGTIHAVHAARKAFNYTREGCRGAMRGGKERAQAGLVRYGEWC